MYIINLVNFSIFLIIISIIIMSTLLVYKNTDKVNHIYLINLKRRPDRLKDFIESYNTCGLNKKQLTKFNAVDGGVLDIKTVPLTSLAILELKQLETIGFRYKHYQLTKGAIGCFMSHVKVWEHILSSGKNSALIFEDDARPPPNFKRLINKTMTTIPDDWDIVLFGKHCYDCEDKGAYLKVNKFILLHSYMISKKCILKIFNENNLFPISQQLDSYLSEISNIINIYAPKTNMVSQNQSRTDIQAPIVKHPLNNARNAIDNKK